MLRRTLLKYGLQGAASLALAADEPTPPILLGFDTYSLRAFKWKALQLIEYAAAQKLDTIQISALEDFESLEPAHLAKVKDRAAALGIVLDGGMGCICPASYSWSARNGDPAQNLAKGLRAAKGIGATSMRCFMGSSDDRFGTANGRPPIPIDKLMEATIAVFRSVRAQAQDLNVKIALENHAGDMQAREVRTIIEEAGKDYVASCLDTGNPMWVAEDPLTTLEVLAPYVVTTHVRDSVLYEHPRGAAAQWVVLGEGSIDFKRFMARYRELCPKAGMQLEVITGRPPRVVPYLEPEFWKVLPKANAGEFARFVAIAKQGKPFNGFMIVEDGFKNPPEEYKAALREQQRLDLERSFDYAKKSLGAGVRWRKA
jgi:sugar phosphate isomerase/epimerase